MRTATPEEISVLETLAVELEHGHVQREVLVQARDRDLRAVERELASAVSIVDELAARALVGRRAILETGHAARLPDHEVRESVDAFHERLDHTLETLAVASFHWKWGQPSKGANPSETGGVPGAGGVLQHSRVSVSAAHSVTTVS